MKLFRKQKKLMGNQFEICVIAENQQLADDQIEVAIKEIQRIEKLLTTFSEESQTNEINRNAGITPVVVDLEVFQLIQRANRISKITQGAFDLSYGSIDKSLWNFDITMKTLPSVEIAKKSVRLINYNNIILDEKNTTVFLKEKGMRIGFGGIGKGYAAEMAKRKLQELGVLNGIVNASGDLCTWGTQTNGKQWTVGIADPNEKIKSFAQMNISNKAIATSGNYEKFITINDKKYSHTINPKTGLPITGISSVTIICNNAEIADAMATPVMVMGIEAGLFMVNQIKDLACIIIDDLGEIYTSKNINSK
ncbi:MAG: FAD:protein FMN transferase [Saprospiraceae bacterium]|nr:FAD:protein FMN transferase [Saprospiraceae bacterium]